MENTQRRGKKSKTMHKKYDPKKHCIVTQMRENQYKKQAVELL